jgi:hypothetical protein
LAQSTGRLATRTLPARPSPAVRQLATGNPADRQTRWAHLDPATAEEAVIRVSQVTRGAVPGFSIRIHAAGFNPVIVHKAAKDVTIVGGLAVWADEETASKQHPLENEVCV